ncbi:MAG TPA: hypothetical protein VM327_00675 [Candidatus Thermoplasmatota archaeon]|nr:hypothetical protein [Candidatus Thermoplasmatota archaeon]
MLRQIYRLSFNRFFMGWAQDVARVVARLPSRFELADAYRFAPELGRLHPENHNVQAKIRQQLQVLRDEGRLRFLDDDGRYEKVGAW